MSKDGTAQKRKMREEEDEERNAGEGRRQEEGNLGCEGFPAMASGENERVAEEEGGKEEETMQEDDGEPEARHPRIKKRPNAPTKRTKLRSTWPHMSCHVTGVRIASRDMASVSSTGARLDKMNS